MLFNAPKAIEISQHRVESPMNYCRMHFLKLHAAFLFRFGFAPVAQVSPPFEFGLGEPQHDFKDPDPV